MANIQVGGKVARNGRFRIERPFVGVIAGLSVNRLRVLDLASERDPHVITRGDVQLVTGVLDRNDLQRMQQVRHFSGTNTHAFTICYEKKKKTKTNANFFIFIRYFLDSAFSCIFIFRLI